MRLNEILQDVSTARISGSGETMITGISYSSSSVRPGHIFAALKGMKTDGFYYIDDAAERGAAAVLSERPRPKDFPLTWVQVPDARLAMAQCAVRFFGSPSRHMKVIGITGTKGKTTVSYLIESILHAAGLKAGLFGTIQYRGPGVSQKAARTTPESPDLQKMLKTMLDNGATHSVMEISSHSLEFHRVAGMDVDVAVFTNLTGEHMDYHRSMERYYLAKKKLFTSGLKTMAVVNIDDSWGKRLKDELRGGALTFGLQPEAMIQALEVQYSLEGIECAVKFPAGRIQLRSPLLGKPNVYNILSAAAACLALNIPKNAIREGILNLKGVPGRFQKIDNSLGLYVFVDYAHTDDALKNLLETARRLCSRQIILTFGAGGDRDKSKRSRMGRIAGEIADWTVLTSDNPRSEDPMAIISDVKQGLEETQGKYEIEPDRLLAIRTALKKAEPGDFVLIAGKGHEDYQILGERVIHFDDAETAAQILLEMEKE